MALQPQNQFLLTSLRVQNNPHTLPGVGVFHEIFFFKLKNLICSLPAKHFVGDH